MPIRRASACVVFDVTLDGDPAWAEGPLPGAAGVPVSGARRLSYLEPRVAEALYGDGTARRWHRQATTDGAPETLCAAGVWAVELLRTPLAGPRSAVAVLHVRLPDDPLAGLAALARATLHDDPGAGRPALAAVLPPGAAVRGRRAQTIAHLTFADPPAQVLPERYAGWPADRQWLWLAASATPLSAFPPDADDPSLFDGLVWLSADWRALVLRDGAAFVGLSADPGGPDSFHAVAATHVHTIYLDLFLLGRMQVGALHALSNRIAQLRVGSVRPRSLHALESQLMEVRRTLWSRHATLRGHGTSLLERYQAQHRLPDLLQHVIADLTDASRLVEAATARSVNAGLGLLTVLGLPFGLAYAGGAVFADQSPLLFAWCTAVAVVIAVLLLLLFPPLLRMVDALRA